MKVFNTLTRQKEDLIPLKEGEFKIYACGPTVYKPSHIGHMVGPVIFDTISKYFTYLGYDVTSVDNITDVDDKLIKFADKSANQYLFDWWQDDLKIIVPPQKKKTEAPKLQELTGKSVSKKKKA